MIRRLWHLALTADPGLQRAYTAGRTTLSVALTLAVAYPAAKAVGQPGTVVMLAVSLAMVTATALSGVTTRDQLRSVAMSCGVALGAVTLGVFASPYPMASYAVFVAVMSAGAWASRFGQPGRAMGLLAFMSYFFALFTHARLPQLPWLLAAAVTAVLITGAVRMVILRDPPARRLRNLLLALRARAEALSRDVQGVPEERESSVRGTLSRDSGRIDEVVLQLHDLLTDSPGVVRDEHCFQRHLFAVVTLGHLLVLRAQHGASAPAVTFVAPPTNPAERIIAHLDALDDAAAGRVEAPIPGTPPPAEERALDGKADVGAVEPAKGLSVSTRTALQVAVAGVIAIAAGHALSEQRWYWAAISAYLVFVNTGSRGATMRKAAERTIGTAAGVGAGILIGYLMRGHGGLELLGIFPLLFIGYWMLPVSYAVMVGLITVLLALLYGVMGMLSADLLLLRLGETAFGTLAGAGVAYFILPTRTRAVLDDAFRDYLAAMDDLLAELTTSLDDAQAASARVLGAVRGLDRALSALRGAVRPVMEAVPGTAARALDQEVTLALAARYWLHRVAAALLFHAAPVDPDEIRGQIATVRERISRLRAGRGGDEPAARGSMGTESDPYPLLRVDALLGELAAARAARP